MFNNTFFLLPNYSTYLLILHYLFDITFKYFVLLATYVLSYVLVKVKLKKKEKKKDKTKKNNKKQNKTKQNKKLSKHSFLCWWQLLYVEYFARTGAHCSWIEERSKVFSIVENSVQNHALCSCNMLFSFASLPCLE